ncbi:SAM-dependent methyltransferase [Streptomyces sp. NPDC057694]|uniref:SAM-dependent methyltransferase n=1 Tax=Streptomyces sp. NPDC057694 TaxID=3346216 RepID=UPI0036B2E27C
MNTASRSRAAEFDAFHTARSRTGLTARFYAAAMGDDYPAEVRPDSSCDWPLLGLIAARLRMPPGQVLVDAGCGSGGIGLWLARALAARMLHGFDLSTAAVDQAAARAPHFLGASPPAAFHAADLAAPGLPDGCAHGIVCVGALHGPASWPAAVAGLGRLLAPGGRLVLTRGLRHGTDLGNEYAAAAGLQTEHVDERPTEPLMWERLYRLWLAHADDLRRELGAQPAQRMLDEAAHMLPRLGGRRAVLITLHRPATGPAVHGATATMTGPDRQSGGSTQAPGRTPR